LSETNTSGAAVPSNQTLVPAKLVATIPPVDTDIGTTAVGPSAEPKIDTISPGATPPAVELAAFTMLRIAGKGGLITSVTRMDCGLLEAPPAVTTI